MNSPDAIKILTGDFNECDFKKCIPHYQQYIDFPTRKGNSLDLFFCNVKNSYAAMKLKPLGVSDHDMCLLTPVYKQQLKCRKPVFLSVFRNVIRRLRKH